MIRNARACRGVKRIALLGLALSLGACSRAEPAEVSPRVAPSLPVRAPVRTLPAEERTWTFESPRLGRIPVVVLLPERRSDQRFPVLVTMHGKGEALKGPERGARGWVEDYGLGKVIERLARPPLTREDFFSLVTEARLDELNRALAEKPYRGLIVVCPYTPNALQGETLFESARALAELFKREVLPRVQRETPALGGAASTGIDGVSLGGRASYGVGLVAPEVFGVVAGLQAAFAVREAPTLVSMALAAKQQEHKQRFRLLTSRKDYYRTQDGRIARAFQEAGLSMRFDVVEGPHGYVFNRGPGAIEMLLFHDRALRGESPP